MGIKGLWSVLAPFNEKKSLHEIRGESVAVDLSGWVCDSQNVTDYHVQPKLYLRTIYLILADIDPIFVLEGDAPQLKLGVMAARNAIQFSGAAPRSENAEKKKPDISRKRFKNVLKECESLLTSMGVRCIKGDGEAEATCAQLYVQGLVDAVVSQDSDCFAYGARRVYRNFSVSTSAGGGAAQGSVDCYDAQKMFTSNGFGRNKMIALALLCGCDYGVGACGTSKTTVVSFLHTVPDEKIIARLVSWVNDVDHYNERSRWVAAPGRCDKCGHVGRSHLKNGCPVCATNKGCQSLGHKAKVAEVKRELTLRSRALTCGTTFPDSRIMSEFLTKPQETINLDAVKYPVPSLIQFVKLMKLKLEWTERYCVEKFLPLLTKCHLQDRVINRSLRPAKIVKKRMPRGIPSFEVIWEDIDGQYEGLIPDEQFEEDEDPSKSWTTTERQDLMRKYYPDIVVVYEESIKKPVKEKKIRQKKVKDKPIKKPKIKETALDLNNSPKYLDESKSSFHRSKANVSVSVKTLKRKIMTNNKRNKQKTIDSFVANKKRKSNLSNVFVKSLRQSFANMSINMSIGHVYASIEKDNIENLEKENIYPNDINFKSDKINYLSMMDKTSNESVDSDLSDLIDNIIAKAPKNKTAKLDNKYVNLVFETNYSTPKKKDFRKSLLNFVHNKCSTPINSPMKKRFVKNIVEKSCQNVNTSFFFDKITNDKDAFELSLDYKHKSAIILDCDTTVDYSLPYVVL